MNACRRGTPRFRRLGPRAWHARARTRLREVTDGCLRCRDVRHAFQDVLAPSRRHQRGRWLEAVLFFQAGENVAAGLPSVRLTCCRCCTNASTRSARSSRGRSRRTRPFRSGFPEYAPGFSSGLRGPGLRNLAAVDAYAGGPSRPAFALPFREVATVPEPRYRMELPCATLVPRRSGITVAESVV